MVSPIVFMIPPPAPWLSMATLQAELRRAIDAEAPAPASPIAQAEQAKSAPHKVDVAA
jgi:hypothetical protein